MSLLVYNASAGSGKTFTLAQQYIIHALNNDNPENFKHILAVTFTNKATAEMKERILIYLYDIMQGECGEDFLNGVREVIKKTDVDDDTLKKRARKTLDAILHDYDHFKVETIDAFFQSLLANIAHELKLPRGFNVELDDKAFIDQAIDRLLLTIGDKKNEGARAVVNRFIQNNLDDEKGWNIAKTLKSFAKKILFSTEYSENEETIEELVKDYDCMEQLGRHLRNKTKQIREERDKLCNETRIVIAELNGSKELKSLNTFCSFTDKVSGPDFYNLAEDMPKTISNFLDDNTNLIKKINHDNPSAETLSLLSNLDTALRRVVDFIKTEGCTYSTCQLLADNLDMLCLMGLISRKVGEVTSEQGAFLLSRTPGMFSKLVQGDDASFVFERTGTTYDHIMIDEFQDTSTMQWKNFRTLLINNQAEGKDSMLVGDVKQSIYRWRGGDWNILQHITDEFPNARPLDKENINFRSQPLIVRFNNEFFTKAAAYLDKKEWTVPSNWQEPVEEPSGKKATGKKTNSEQLGRMQKIYNNVRQKVKKKGKGYVRITTSKKREFAQVLDDMYEQIMKLHNDFNVPFSGMVILVRTNKEGDKIVDHFAKKYKDCKLTSDEAFLLSSSVMVQCLILSLRLILNKKDLVSAELLEQGYRSMIDDLKSEADKTDFNSSFAKFKTYINEEKTIDYCRQMPLYELVQDLAKRLRFEEMEEKAGMGQSAYLFSFMDELVAYLNNNPSDIAAFLDYWDETLCGKAVSASSNDSIQILTIHKAKGLERHTVFIPTANFALEKFMPDSLVWCTTKDKKEELADIAPAITDFPVLPIKFHATRKVRASVFTPEYEKECEQQRIDNLNTLYVAFTRARCNLLIWSDYKAKSAYELIKAFVHNLQPGADLKENAEKEPLITEYGELATYTIKAEEKKENPFVTSPSEEIEVKVQEGDLEKTEFMQSSKAREFLADTEEKALGDTEALQHTQQLNEYINRGKLFHKVFELIRTKDDISQAVNRLYNQGYITSESEKKAVEQEVREHMSLPSVKTWFDGSYDLHNECSILFRGEDGTTKIKRPDRVMVNDNEAIVVDYKFGKQHKKYDEQVLEYMEKIQQLLHKPVKGYLWYVRENNVKEVLL